VTVAFNPVHPGFLSNMTGHAIDLYYALPIVVMAVVVATVVLDAACRRVRVYKILWIVVAAFTCESKLWGLSHTVFAVPHWLWQVVLVPTALVLAAKPLFSAISSSETTDSIEKSDLATL
jgi:hypothetical protein